MIDFTSSKRCFQEKKERVGWGGGVYIILLFFGGCGAAEEEGGKRKMGEEKSGEWEGELNRCAPVHISSPSDDLVHS
jgi:hypothetical protein